MTVSSEITPEQLLEAREQRAGKQKKLIEKYGLPLVSFTINIPGASKKTLVSERIFHEGCKVLVKKLEENGCTSAYSESNEPETGYEAYFVVNTDKRTLKSLMLLIENQHPLGRLFDLDVIGLDGYAISREDLGYSKRKCLLCEQDAHICVRSRKHSAEELVQKIQFIVDSYFQIVS